MDELEKGYVTYGEGKSAGAVYCENFRKLALHLVPIKSLS
jgi:hypothetical protein